MAYLYVKTLGFCNNNCFFCSEVLQSKKTSNFRCIKGDLVEGKEFFEKVSFGGGEPTMRPDFFDILKLAKSLRFKKIQVQSNGRIFSCLDFCKKTISSGANCFFISLHGFYHEQHDFLTRTPGSFKQTIKGIKNLISLGQQVFIRTVVVKPNFRNLHRISSLSFLFGANGVYFDFFCLQEEYNGNSQSLIPRFTLTLPFLKRAIEIANKNNKKITIGSFPYCLIEVFKPSLVGDLSSVRRVIFKKCEGCNIKGECGGVPEQYLNVYGDKEFDFLK